MTSNLLAGIQKTRLAVCIVATITTALLGASPMQAEDDFPKDQFITRCTTISQPGSYIVTNNIQANAGNLQTDPADPTAAICIDITADFVTLDLAGHTIFGPAGGLVNSKKVVVGILATGHNAIEVRNGAVTGFGFGVVLAENGLIGGNGLIVEKMRALNNKETGIEVGFGGSEEGHRVVGNTAVNNGGGGIAVNCPAVVLENVASGNHAFQIGVVGANCTLLENSPAP